MAIKSFKPYTPSRRGMTSIDYSAVLSGDKPEKKLLKKKNRKAGRNSQGRVTVRCRGGGNRQHYRIVDFSRRKDEGRAEVKSIQYDPNRSAFIALISYVEDNKLSYIIAPEGLKVGDYVASGPSAEIRMGNTMALDRIPDGTMVHNIELLPGQGAKLVRAAGAAAQLMAKEGKDAIIRLPSGEMRRVSRKCRATIGQVSNLDHDNVKLGKAGRKRHLGRRPHVRGTVMNPVDHPHGGGEGRTTGGRNPVSPWGWCTKGMKTRKNARTQRYIVSTRKKKR